MNTERQTDNNRDSRGRFTKGNAGGGRPKGSPNRFTKTFKSMVEGELERLGPDHFHRWALENPTDFYRLSARLLPSVRELSGPDGRPIEQRVRTDPKEYTMEELYRIIEGSECAGPRLYSAEGKVPDLFTCSSHSGVHYRLD